MNSTKNRIELKNSSSQVVTAGEFTLTPQSQALIVRLPYFRAVWNRPVAVVVERGGEIQRLPIVDVTRLVQLCLIAVSAACWIAFFLLQQSRRTAALRK